MIMEKIIYIVLTYLTKNIDPHFFKPMFSYLKRRLAYGRA